MALSDQARYVLDQTAPVVNLALLAPSDLVGITREVVNRCLAVKGMLLFKPVCSEWEFAVGANGRWSRTPPPSPDITLPSGWDGAVEVCQLTTLESHRQEQSINPGTVMYEEHILLVTPEGELVLSRECFHCRREGGTRKDQTTQVGIGFLSQEQAEQWFTADRVHTLLEDLAHRARHLNEDVAKHAQQVAGLSSWLEGIRHRQTHTSPDDLDDDIPF